jgi:hypothetical protein
LAAAPTRRAVLTATAALPLALTGCKGLSALSVSARPPADVTMLQHAIAAEALLAARYRTAIGALAASPAVEVLRQVLGQHEEHLARLRAYLVIPPGQASPATGPRHPPAAPPAGSRPALAALQAAERDAAARLSRQLMAAPAPLAQLLASIAASEASHVLVLAAARRAA